MSRQKNIAVLGSTSVGKSALTLKYVHDQFPDYYFTPQLLDKPPPEEFLVQNTLWPEMHKMYGHGYELYAVAANKDGSMVASACKSAQPQEAAIIIWNTKTWKQVRFKLLI